MDNELVIHTRLNDLPDNEQLDPFCLERPLEWRSLEALLKASYKIPQKRIDVRYMDEDGDMIIISSQDELDEAVRLSQQSQKALMLQIRSMEPQFSSAEIRPSAPPSEDRTDEKLMLDASPEEEAAPSSPIEETKRCMVPGALSGANVVAIEIPDCPGEGHAPCDLEAETEHRQGTEAAEPAETLETGEVAPKLRRDEETGYWIVKKLKKTLHLQSAEEKAGSVDEQQGMHIKPLDQPSITSLSKAGKRHRLAEDLLEDEAVAKSLPYQPFVLYLEKMKEDLIRKFPHKIAKEVIRRLETKHFIPPGSVVSASPKRSRDRSTTIHNGVVCDGCEKVVVGIRYKCGNCVNYNLCENCEARPDAHNSDHVFLKLRRPCPRASSLHAPILGCTLYSSSKEGLDTEISIGKKGELEKLFRKADKLKRLEIKNKEKLRRKEEKLRWKKEQILAKEGIVHLQSPDNYGVLKADFVSDITLPDYSAVEPGEFLTKTWCMENGGTIPWHRKTVLRMIRSNMEAVVEAIDVPPLLPGERTNLTVQLVAPMEPGRYESHWRLYAGDVMFGHIVYCIVDVKEMPAVETDATTLLETPAAKCTSEEKPEIQEPLTCPLACVFNEYENSCSTQKHKPALPLICIEEESFELAASGACQTDVIYDAAKNTSEATCAESPSHLSAAAENVEQPEKLERPPPAIVKQPDGDRDFWSKRFIGMSVEREPSTPNNTPLDVSPPPERSIHFPEPELLKKLSLRVLDSSVVHDAPECRCKDISLTTTMVDDCNPFQVLVERSAQEQADAGNMEGEHSSVVGWTFVHEHSPDSSASTASSVEVVTGEELVALDHHQQSQQSSIAEYLSKVASLNPSDWQGMHRYAELESLDSFSDDSSSLDEDFFIVKLPDCFDISKPLHAEDLSSWNDQCVSHAGCLAPREDTREQGEDAEDQSDLTSTDAQVGQPSLDEMLKASGTITAPTLVPTLLPAADAATCADSAISFFREDEGQITDAEAAAAGEYEDAVEGATEDNTPSSAREETSEGSPAESAETTEGDRGDEEDADGGTSARVSGACEEVPFLPISQDHVDHLVQSAVSVAGQVFNTVKDVFYTLQGRQLQNDVKASTWKPPESSWTPPKSEWTPPKSEWTPPQSKWKPPQSEWKPPANTWTHKADSEWDAAQEPDGVPSEAGMEARNVDEGKELEGPHAQAMTRLLEMGFYNRGLNQRLLEEHDGDLDPVLSELLQLTQNDWAASRH